MSSNPDLVKARARASFDVEPMTHWLDGGVERTLARRKLLALLESDPLFDTKDDIHHDRLKKYTKALARARRLKEIEASLKLSPEDFAVLKECASFDDPTTLHELMFSPNIEALCSPEQKREWLPKCRDWRVIGCYAQTEVGHGSNVRGIETVARYLPDSFEFELDSPTLTSTKFWPGSMGRTANHAMVIARLVTPDGKDRGNHNFILQIRDLATHEPCPGVILGDIGPKLGFNNMDNGFLRLQGVRIPYENMAARFAHVNRVTGEYVRTADDTAMKLAGLTMTQVRAYLVQQAGRALAAACTVAIRYSSVRRQGFDHSPKTATLGRTDEHAVWDYPTQRMRLLPLLASAYCYHVGGVKLGQLLRRAELSVGDGSVSPELLAELHATSSGLKAITTGTAGDGIETCRRACGGHGYLQASGLPGLLGTYLQSVTVEGDNFLLPQQTTKFLLNVLEAIRATSPATLPPRAPRNQGASRPGHAGPEGHAKGAARFKGLPESCTYLAAYVESEHGGAPMACSALGPQDLLSARALQRLLDSRAGRLVVQVEKLLARLLTSQTRPTDEEEGRGLSFHEAWTSSLVEVGRASSAHCEAHLFRTFNDFVMEETEKAVRGDGDGSGLGVGPSAEAGGGSAGLRDLGCLESLGRLVLLHGLQLVSDSLSDHLEAGTLSPVQAQMVREAQRQLVLGEDGRGDSLLAGDALALCDAWDLADRQLQNSTLGRRDGMVYEAVLEAAQRSTLNTELALDSYRHLVRPLDLDPQPRL